jgi:hypothetical protein
MKQQRRWGDALGGLWPHFGIVPAIFPLANLDDPPPRNARTAND